MRVHKNSLSRQRHLSESTISKVGRALAKPQRRAVTDAYEKFHHMHFISSSKFFFFITSTDFPGGFLFKTNPPTPQKHSRQTRVGLCPVLCHSVLSDSVGWWDGKKRKNQSMTKLLDAPTQHLTLQLSHTIMPTSPSLNCSQLTELGCDVHQRCRC